MDAVKIRKQFENKNHNFNLGAHNIKVTTNDVRLILGIDYKDKQANLKYGLKNQEFMIRRKMTSDRLTTKSLKKTI